jgi:hypothetical protein
MTPEDYLGITALALAELAELLANSIESDDVRPIVIDHLMTATLKWAGDANPVKDNFVSEVKKSIDELQNWRTKYPTASIPLDLHQLN